MSPPTVTTAFQAVAGTPAAYLRDALTLILAALMLLWLAAVVAKLGEQVVSGRVKQATLLAFALRAALLTTLVVSYLVR